MLSQPYRLSTQKNRTYWFIYAGSRADKIGATANLTIKDIENILELFPVSNACLVKDNLGFAILWQSAQPFFGCVMELQIHNENTTSCLVQLLDECQIYTFQIYRQIDSI
jgi:hypothetical protein